MKSFYLTEIPSNIHSSEECFGWEFFLEYQRLRLQDWIKKISKTLTYPNASFNPLHKNIVESFNISSNIICLYLLHLRRPDTWNRLNGQNMCNWIDINGCWRKTFELLKIAIINSSIIFLKSFHMTPSLLAFVFISGCNNLIVRILQHTLYRTTHGSSRCRLLNFYTGPMIKFINQFCRYSLFLHVIKIVWFS